MPHVLPTEIGSYTNCHPKQGQNTCPEKCHRPGYRLGPSVTMKPLRLEKSCFLSAHMDPKSQDHLPPKAAAAGYVSGDGNPQDSEAFVLREQLRRLAPLQQPRLPSTPAGYIGLASQVSN